MTLEKTKSEALNTLLQNREKIENIVAEIEALLQVYFPEEFATAYQHWLPQIKTALKDNTKWLPRGQYSMDYTINRLIDKMTTEINMGVSKYIK